MQVIATSNLDCLFPAYTENWFHPKTRTTSVLHNFYELDTSEKLERCKSAFVEYFYDLTSIIPPEHWFSDEEFPKLFEELKHIIGEPSTTQGSGARNLTLGNAVLLLAAASKEKSASWIQSVHWKKITNEILPEQDRVHAIAASFALTSLFEKLCTGALHRESLIRRVNLSDKILQIWIDMDCTYGGTGGPSLIDQAINLPATDIRHGEEGAYAFYRKFIIESAINKYGGRESRCVVNFHPLNGGEPALPSQTLLELVPCQ